MKKKPSRTGSVSRRGFLKWAAFGGGLLAGGGIVGGLGLTGKKTAPDKNIPQLVLFYSPCTVNKHFLAPYNEKVAFTPELGRFGKTAAIAGECRAAAGQTGICYASLFSGCYADRHGVYEHPSLIDEKVPLITETFANAGYDPYFWGGHAMARYQFGYGRGVPKSQAYYRSLEADDKVFRSVLQKARKDPDYKAFLLTHFTVTHFPYPDKGPEVLPEEFARTGLTPEEFKLYSKIYHEPMQVYRISFDFDGLAKDMGLDEKGKARFASAVEYKFKLGKARLDKMFGEVLKALEEEGLLDKTLVVFTADHGETMYRPGVLWPFFHGFACAPEVLSVPWLLSGPGIKPGYRNVTASATDVFPTVAGLAGISPPKVDGRDLSGYLKGTAPLPDAAAYSHTSLLHDALFHVVRTYPRFARFFPESSPETMWVSAKEGNLAAKWVKTEEHPDTFAPEIYDHATDPMENKNVFDADSPDHAKALEKASRFKARLVADCHKRYGTSAPKGPTREESVQSLKELGYI